MEFISGNIKGKEYKMKKLLRNVVVIEDDPIMREMICWDLQNIPSLLIESFSSGEECYKSYNKEPDILILDYNLKDCEDIGVDGVKFSYLFPGAKKILISANDNPEMKEIALKNDFYRFISKDVDVLGRVTNTVKELINELGKPERVRKSLSKIFYYNYWLYYVLCGLILLILIMFVIMEV